MKNRSLPTSRKVILWYWVLSAPLQLIARWSFSIRLSGSRSSRKTLGAWRSSMNWGMPRHGKTSVVPNFSGRHFVRTRRSWILPPIGACPVNGRPTNGLRRRGVNWVGGNKGRYMPKTCVAKASAPKASAPKACQARSTNRNFFGKMGKIIQLGYKEFLSQSAFSHS